MTTLIEDLKLSNDIDEEIKIEELEQEELYKYIFDLSNDRVNRMKSLLMYFNKYGEEDTLELTNRICGMYQFSGASLINEFLTEICYKENEISDFIRLECSKSLLLFTEFPEKIREDEKEEMKEIKEESNKQIIERNNKRIKNGYKCLDFVCSNFCDIATPCKVEAVVLLMNDVSYKDNCLKYLCNITNDDLIDCDYRYKIILSLETKELDSKEYYLKNTLMSFLNNKNNRMMYRILSAQYLLQNIEISQELNHKVQSVLLGFAQDEGLDYNLRADAADTILHVGNDKNKRIAREIIMILGRIDDDNNIDIYSNAQNVHNVAIEESLINNLEFLISVPLYEIEKNIPININWIEDKIKETYNNKGVELCLIEKCFHNKCLHCKSCLCENEFSPLDNVLYSSLREQGVMKSEEFDEDIQYCNDECFEKKFYQDQIHISLNRIKIDRVLYSKYNQTLMNILLKVCSFIFTHEEEDELLKRLKEELYDMAGTCSTGFASRLINVLSGYDDFNVKISFSDQIVSNFQARINSRMQKITDKDSIYYNDKKMDIVWLYMNTHNLVEKKLSKDELLENKTKSEIIDEYLEIDRERKIDLAVEDFSDSILVEMLNTNNYYNRPNFIKFFRDNVPFVRNELYQEFCEYVSDVNFDVSIRKAINYYEGM